jgi:hypothetical protein
MPSAIWAGSDSMLVTRTKSPVFAGFIRSLTATSQVSFNDAAPRYVHDLHGFGAHMLIDGAIEVPLDRAPEEEDLATISQAPSQRAGGLDQLDHPDHVSSTLSAAVSSETVFAIPLPRGGSRWTTPCWAGRS